MSSKPSYDLPAIIDQFQIRGNLVEVRPHGTGHINDTFASRVSTPAGLRRFIHQRINHSVFKQPEQVMENIVRVLAHLTHKLGIVEGDDDRRVLTLIPAKDGRAFHRDAHGNTWRTYRFIEGATTYDVVTDLRHVVNAAAAFGEFQLQVSDLSGPRLHETIAGFHHTPGRFAAFQKALDADAANRAAAARPEIDFVLDRKADTSVFVDLHGRGAIRERITHNDTKLNNVMLDDQTGEAVCVIDLDTVMPGFPMYDFGDSVRIAANPASEDERNLSKVRFDLDMFDCLARGYLGKARDFLTATEIDHLAFGAKLMTFECGMRFVADFLAGDVYFKTHKPGHNLDRARTQFKMVADMEACMDRMIEVVRRHASS